MHLTPQSFELDTEVGKSTKSRSLSSGDMRSALALGGDTKHYTWDGIGEFRTCADHSIRRRLSSDYRLFPLHTLKRQ